eukprot:111571-Prorocentrum_minimum.AAC.4
MQLCVLWVSILTFPPFRHTPSTSCIPQVCVGHKVYPETRVLPPRFKPGLILAALNPDVVTTFCSYVKLQIWLVCACNFVLILDGPYAQVRRGEGSTHAGDGDLDANPRRGFADDTARCGLRMALGSPLVDEPAISGGRCGGQEVQ